MEPRDSPGKDDGTSNSDTWSNVNITETDEISDDNKVTIKVPKRVSMPKMTTHKKKIGAMALVATMEPALKMCLRGMQIPSEEWH